MALEIRSIAHGGADYAAEVDLRDRVLRRPLGLAFSPEQLAAEAPDLHLGGWLEGRLAACLVLTDLGGGTFKMRQVAVDPGLQGRGLGAELVRASEEEARRRGARRMVLNARDTAVPFYLRLGYACVGEPFEEVTIPHRKMEKEL